MASLEPMCNDETSDDIASNNIIINKGSSNAYGRDGKRYAEHPLESGKISLYK